MLSENLSLPERLPPSIDGYPEKNKFDGECPDEEICFQRISAFFHFVF